jgi:hypothetical protein
MGRKGVSKRKSSQTKFKLFSNDPTSGTVSSVMKAAQSPEKTSPSVKEGEKTSSDRKKSVKKK